MEPQCWCLKTFFELRHRLKWPGSPLYLTLEARTVTGLCNCSLAQKVLRDPGILNPRYFCRSLHKTYTEGNSTTGLNKYSRGVCQILKWLVARARLEYYLVMILSSDLNVTYKILPSHSEDLWLLAPLTYPVIHTLTLRIHNWRNKNLWGKFESFKFCASFGSRTWYF